MRTLLTKGPIRSRLAIVSGCVLMAALLMFILTGSRILISIFAAPVHSVRVATQEADTALRRSFERIDIAARQAALEIARNPGHAMPENLGHVLGRLRSESGRPYALAALIDDRGSVDSVWIFDSFSMSLKRLRPESLAVYRTVFAGLLREGQLAPDFRGGIVDLLDVAYVFSMAPVRNPHGQPLGGYVLVGTVLEDTGVARSSSFSEGVDVRLEPSLLIRKYGAWEGDSFCPPLYGSQEHRALGKWSFSEETFETRLPMRDIRGTIVSDLLIVLPHSLTTAVGEAIGLLAILIVGIMTLFVCALFYFQHRLVFVPLDDLDRRILALGDIHREAPQKKVEWPNEDEFGVVAGNINRLLDEVTQKTVRAEMAEARLRALLAALPDGLCVFDSEGRLVRVRKQPVGYLPIPGLSVGQRLNPDAYATKDIEHFCDHCAMASDNGVIYRLRLIAGVGDDARFFDVRIRAFGAGLVLVVFTDVTRREVESRRRTQAEKRLAQARRRESVGLFSRGLAHDLRNSMSAVRNTVASLFFESRDPDVLRVKRMVEDAFDKGDAIVRDLIDMSGEKRMTLTSIDAKRFLESLPELFDGMLPAGVRLQVSAAADVPPVLADTGKFWRIFANLVKNAAEAMAGSTDGLIEIRARAHTLTAKEAAAYRSSSPVPLTPGVLFELRDNGPGIPAEVLSRLFEPYVSSKGHQRGLGMAIVDGLVDAHHGAIAVRSVVGKGTAFRLWFPESRELPEVNPEAPVPVADVPEGVGCLIVDDDDAILFSMRMVLERVFRARVFTANSLETACECLRRHGNELNLVFLDATFGNTLSVEYPQRFREIVPDLPIILLSGIGRDRVGSLFAEAELAGFLPKPHTVDNLRLILARYGVRREG